MKKPDRDGQKKIHEDNSIRLGSLLNKGRSPLKQEAVDAVRLSSASLREKIERIEHIDGVSERYTPEETPRPAPAHRPPENDDLSVQLDDEEHNELRQAAAHRQKLIRPQTENRFLPYLVREYPKIKKFGATCGVLEPRFPFRFTLSKRALGTIAADLERIQLPSSVAALEQVIQNGWRFLEKFEYNCILVLEEYCRTLAVVDFPTLHRSDRLLLHRFKDLERLYLLLQDPRVRSGVFSGLEKAASENPHGAIQMMKCESRARALLAETSGHPTVGNLILGLTMIRWRRFFRLSELADYSVGGLVCRTFFNCPDKVHLAINAFIETREVRLRTLIRERARLAREIDFFPLDQRGRVNYEDLIGFYNRKFDPDNSGSWKRDGEQVLFFLVRIIDLFINKFRFVLETLRGLKPADGAAFGVDFDRLAFAEKRLERHTFLYGSISRSRYLEIRETNKTATEIEAEAFSIVADLLAHLHSIARRVSFHLSLPTETADAGIAGAEVPVESGKVEPDDQSVPVMEKPEEKSWGDTPRYAAAIAYGIGLYLADPALTGFLKHETPLKEEFEAIMQTLKRIAPTRIYNDILKAYEM
jgi:hypothetical protein